MQIIADEKTMNPFEPPENVGELIAWYQEMLEIDEVEADLLAGDLIQSEADGGRGVFKILPPDPNATMVPAWFDAPLVLLNPERWARACFEVLEQMGLVQFSEGLDAWNAPNDAILARGPELEAYRQPLTLH